MDKGSAALVGDKNAPAPCIRSRVSVNLPGAVQKSLAPGYTEGCQCRAGQGSPRLDVILI